MPRTLPWNIMIGSSLLLGPILLTLCAPFLSLHDPNAPYNGPVLSGPSLAHPLGTDLLGRDQLARVVYGGRVALGIAGVALGVIVTVGAVAGCVAGYYGGRVDGAISVLLNVVLALPELTLTLALVAVLGPGVSSLMLALTATAWADYARLFRGAVLSTREQVFVEAARALGVPQHHIVLRHILPNVARPILALASLRFAGLLLAVASLSFLGLGVQPPMADWGTMLNDARSYLRTAPHLAFFPALCIVVVSLGGDLVADALLDERKHTWRRNTRHAYDDD